MTKKTSTEEDTDSFKLDEAIGHLLRRAYQRASSLLISQIGQYGITPVQFATLARLAQHESLSQNQLGYLVDIAPGNFHGVIDRLLQRKLVSKRKDPSDQRKIILRLSDEGRDLLTVLIPMSKKSTASTLAPLTELQRKQLYKLLNRILE